MSGLFYVTATIEGALNQWNTSVYGAGGGTHGRTIQRGLQHSGLKVGERSNILKGTIDVDTITLSILATDASNDEFTRSARILTYLSSSVTTAATTTFNVRSNGLLVDDAWVHIGTECVQITDPTTLAITVVRAQRDTVAQVHLRDDGANASEVPIWNKVQAWEGRRVTLTAYEAGASSTIMRGIITQAPYLSEDGTMWLIDVDSIVKALDQEVGRPVDIHAAIKGLKYGTSSAFGFVYGTTAVFSLVGWYATEQAFITALNVELDAVAITGVDDVWATMTFDDSGAPAVQLWLRVGAADIDPPAIHFGSFADGYVSLPGSGYNLTSNGVVLSGTVLPSRLLAGSTYVAVMTSPMRPGAGVFNRHLQDAKHGAALIHDKGGTSSRGRFNVQPLQSVVFADYPFTNATDASNDTTDASLMLDQLLPISATDILVLTGDTLPEELRLVVSSTFATNGVLFDPVASQLDDYCDRNGIDFIYVDDRTEIRVTKPLGTGDLSDFMAALIAAAPYANLGNVPFITSLDATTSATAVGLATRGIACLEDRNYNVTEDISVADLIAPELLLLGMMMAIDTDGKIAFRPFFVPAKTTPVAATLTAANVVTPFGDVGMWPGWIPATDGIISIVDLTGAKSLVASQRTMVLVGGRWVGVGTNNTNDPSRHIYRDIASISAHKNRGQNTLKIQPEASSSADLTVSDAISISERIVSFFGRPYEVVTLKVRRTATTLALRCGSLVALTSDHVPNSGDGTRGVTARRCLVIGRGVSYDPAEDGAVVSLTLVMHATEDGTSLNIAGYAGSALATNAADQGGNLWDITITAQVYAPTGSYDYEFFTVGDYVNVVQVNDSTPNSRTGTVISTSSTNIRVQFTGAAPWGGAWADSYVIEFADVSYGMSDPQDDYCYTADSGLLLSNGNPARVML